VAASGGFLVSNLMITVAVFGPEAADPPAVRERRYRAVEIVDYARGWLSILSENGFDQRSHNIIDEVENAIATSQRQIAGTDSKCWT
jgi:hypothetical protein